MGKAIAEELGSDPEPLSLQGAPLNTYIMAPEV